MTAKTPTVTMPPGDYILGDPGYTLKEELRQEYRNQSAQAQQEPFSVQGQMCLQFGTAHGDGSYYDQEHFEYPVDSGSIALLHASLTQLDDRHRPFVKQVSFDQPFRCSADYRRNILKFGHITIDVS